MSSKHSGGRVFAGEDSEEEDEEEEIEYSFQFSSSATQASAAAAPAFSLPTAAAAAPRFSVQAPVVTVAAAAGGGEESDEDESDGDEETRTDILRPAPKVALPAVVITPPVGVSGEDSEDDDDNNNEQDSDGNDVGASMRGGAVNVGAAVDALQLDVTSSARVVSSLHATSPGSKASKPIALTPAARETRDAKPLSHTTTIEDDDAHWELDEAAIGSGVQVMGDAIVSRLQPSLDDSIQRIAELTESQQHLLQLLSTQSASICASEQIQKIAIVMDKLPHYIRKVQDLKAAMTDISTSVEKMKKRAESLRVDAQSHAIKKENKRDSMSQWNKMVAATKSTESAAGRSFASE